MSLPGPTDPETNTAAPLSPAGVQEARAQTAQTLRELEAALNDVRVATHLLHQAVHNEALGEAGRLNEALRAATARVEEETAAALAALHEPARQAGNALLRAHETSDALTENLRSSLLDTESEYHQRRLAEGREARWLLRGVAFLLTFLLLLTLTRGCDEPAPEPEAGEAAVEADTVAVEPGRGLSASSVQVLNGAGVRRSLAAPIVTQLRNAGIAGTVLDGANAAAGRYDSTRILLHGASRSAGDSLATYLNLRPERVVEGTPDPQNGDLTLLIGADYERALPFLRPPTTP